MNFSHMYMLCGPIVLSYATTFRNSKNSKIPSFFDTGFRSLLSSPVQFARWAHVRHLVCLSVCRLDSHQKLIQISKGFTIMNSRNDPLCYRKVKIKLVGSHQPQVASFQVAPVNVDSDNDSGISHTQTDIIGIEIPNQSIDISGQRMHRYPVPSSTSLPGSSFHQVHGFELYINSNQSS